MRPLAGQPGLQQTGQYHSCAIAPNPTIKEPRNPLPPVTITRLSCQKVALSGQAGGIGSTVDMAGRIRELLELQKPNEDSL